MTVNVQLSLYTREPIKWWLENEVKMLVKSSSISFLFVKKKI